jgi:hypothetical protein
VLQSALLLLVFAVTCLMHGLVPGVMFPSLGIPFPTMAHGHAMALDGVFHYSRYFGHPYGAPLVNGLPIALVQALIMRVFSTGPIDAYVTSYGAFLALAFFGAWRLFRRFDLGPWLSILGAGLFLSSIFVVGHQDFASLMIGFALLPLSAWLDLKMLAHFRARETLGWTWLALLLVSVLWKSLLLLIDGYSFVISAVFSGAVLAFGWVGPLRIKRLKLVLVCALSVAIAHVAAYLVYLAYVPGAKGYDAMPADFLRAQGADLATLVIPFNQSTQLSRWLKMPATSHRGQEFYGDGSNAVFNYIGLTLLLAIPGMILTWRRHRELRPLLVAGGVCFVLSIGPSIKIHNLRPPPEKGRVIGFNDYLMKPQEAFLNLHTEDIYLSVPGVKIMRSVYRWQIGFRIVATALALLTIAALYDRRWRISASAMLLILAIDSIPPVWKKITRYAAQHQAAERLFTDVLGELCPVIARHSQVVFVSTENDYLANPIAVSLECFSYNVGGDKNQMLASPQWPAEIREIMARKNIVRNAERLHASGRLDYVILPYFNLRWDSYAWPPKPAKLQEGRRAVEALLQDVRGNFTITRGAYTAVIDLRAAPAPASTTPP